MTSTYDYAFEISDFGDHFRAIKWNERPPYNPTELGRFSTLEAARERVRESMELERSFGQTVNPEICECV